VRHFCDFQGYTPHHYYHSSPLPSAFPWLSILPILSYLNTACSHPPQLYYVYPCYKHSIYLLNLLLNPRSTLDGCQYFQYSSFLESNVPGTFFIPTRI
jgi:hypothetical protein